ncbi:hypothetical protein N7462_011534 [Penicillium macrosclerotiorum]|uniref:uncharacterized protein n=1 Tax=Penicillium macrosclerotiorum TaxID=303699 RepID=UPI0025489F16|nr:uncharacterized protein N7462_011534 [Penicillium macrosclerotiorum]KAJ5664721.1 hypothetical protein N7462_011534 [Penicillium macrosclerotiorum]
MYPRRCSWSSCTTSSNSSQGSSPIEEYVHSPTALRFHPQFFQLLDHFRTPLHPLISCTNGQAHPDFPPNILAFHLLTSCQLDNLAYYYHQVWPATVDTKDYPVSIRPWLGTPYEATIDLATKRRRFGQFIGLQGCESPIDDHRNSGQSEPESELSESGSELVKDEHETETEQQILERIEWEWQEALVAALKDRNWFGWK